MLDSNLWGGGPARKQLLSGFESRSRTAATTAAREHETFRNRGTTRLMEAARTWLLSIWKIV
jgi:hypothetical protein